MLKCWARITQLAKIECDGIEIGSCTLSRNDYPIAARVRAIIQISGVRLYRNDGFVGIYTDKCYTKKEKRKSCTSKYGVKIEAQP